MLTKEEFAKRRKDFLQQMSENSIAILPTNSQPIRNGDSHYAYRPHSDFYYLTGFTEPEAVAVFIKTENDEQYILFNRLRNPERELWDGMRAGQIGAVQEYGADQSFPIDELSEKLISLLAGKQRIYYALGRFPEFDGLLIEKLNTLRNKVRGGVQVPTELINSEVILHEMRLIKSPQEVAILEKAAEITGQAHKKAMQICRPGLIEYQLAALMSYEFQQNGCRHFAYSPIVGGGANACILHYNENQAVLKEGELVLVDVGVEYEWYAADVTRTYPVSGRFTAEQRAIYEIVLQAQLAGIAEVKPGNLWPKIQEVMVKIITEGLLELGILQGTLEELIEMGAYKAFYMHNSGHWLGLDVHDAGNYKPAGEWRILQPGIYLTVEPGIYIPADNPQVSERWWNIGVRIEDDVLVTTKGNSVLTAAAPKQIAEIEQVMAHHDI